MRSLSWKGMADRGGGMRALLIGVGAALAAAACNIPAADAAGCLKGAAVGGLAGPEVGSGHGVAGAGIGCAVGHHQAKKKAEQKTQQDSQHRAEPSNDAGSSGSSESGK
jgi:outer membrane lipoprotein SlyB